MPNTDLTRKAVTFGNAEGKTTVENRAVRQHRVALLAMAVGLVSVGAASFIGLYARHVVAQVVEARHREFFLHEAGLLAAVAAGGGEAVEENTPDGICDMWGVVSVRPAREYVAVFRADGTLAACCGMNGFPGDDPRNRSVAGVPLPPPDLLLNTQASGEIFAGTFAADTGAACVGAVLPVGGREWLVAVYRPRDALLQDVRRDIRSLRWLYIAICSGLLPGSLLLMYVTVWQSVRIQRSSEMALRETQGTLRALVNASNDSAMLLDTQGAILAVNESAAAELGRSPAELIGRNAYAFLTSSVAEERQAQVQEAIRSGLPVRCEAKHRGRLLDVSVNPVYDLKGAVSRIAIFEQDVTERREAENALRRSEERFRKLAKHAPVGIFLTDVAGECQYMNERWQEMSGGSPSEIKGGHWGRRLHPEDRSRVLREWEDASHSAEEFVSEFRFQSPDGAITWLSCSAVPLWDDTEHISGYLCTANDITERKRAEEELRASLAEKEVLLKEIHHRVKNNLQITSSLLELQSQTIADAQVAALLQDSRRRVHAMALVHEKLYGSNNLGRVGAREYFGSLVDAIFASFGARAANVIPKIDIVDVALDVDTAVPCGLLVNELVGNALEHAFPDRGEGRVQVRLTAGDEGYRLEVADDGRGLPADIDIENPPSLGLQLVRTLTAQLRGDLTVTGERGAVFTVTFRGK